MGSFLLKLLEAYILEFKLGLRRTLENGTEIIPLGFYIQHLFPCSKINLCIKTLCALIL